MVKSLIVEAQKRKNHFGARAKQLWTRFLENLKGTIFYGVPHTGGEQYFVDQSQQLKTGIWKNVEAFNRQMAALSVDFENAVDPAVIIYASGEGPPLIREVSFSSKSLGYNNDYKVDLFELSTYIKGFSN